MPAAVAASCRICESARTTVVAGSLKDTGVALCRCGECHSEFLDPQPSPDDIRKIYGAEYYRSWNMAAGENPAVAAIKKSTFARRIRDLKRFVTGGRILDVGTATGFFLEVAREAGFEPYGVELSEYSAGIAAKKFGADRIHIGTLETAPFPAGMFDAIAMTDLIEHVPSPIDTLRVAHRSLKPGGVVILTTPDTGSLSRKLMGTGWTHYKAEHLFYFNADSIAVLARNSGFRVALCRSAEKTMNIGYLHSQLTEYRHWALTPLIRLAAAVCRPFAAYPIPLKMGELVVVLEKQN